MKKITEYFANRNILFREFEKFDLKKLNSKKKLELFCAESIKNEYVAVFVIEQKSRFLIKNANELFELFEKLVIYKDHNFKRKFLIINSPLCSKAKEFLVQNNWSVRSDFNS